MSGTVIGGKKAGVTNKERHGENFYREIGRKGGKLSTTGGFATKTPCECNILKKLHTKPMCSGSKGGRKSSRKGVKNG